MKVKRKAASHFKTVVGHYGCSPAEVDLMRAAYERDPENAAICFAAMAAYIEAVTPPAEPQEGTLTDEQFLEIGRQCAQQQAANDQS